MAKEYKGQMKKAATCVVKITKKVPYYATFPSDIEQTVPDFIAYRLKMDKACEIISGDVSAYKPTKEDKAKEKAIEDAKAAEKAAAKEAEAIEKAKAKEKAAKAKAADEKADKAVRDKAQADADAAQANADRLKNLIDSA